jgi:prephenate dehydrogenase
MGAFLFRQMAVLGVGLIGGSLGLAAKERGLVDEVVGYGRDPGNMRIARRKGLIDRVCRDLREAVSHADLVVLATPVGTMSLMARSVAPHLKSRTIVMDVGSVKGPILREVEGLLPRDAPFIAAHPIAGTEQWGAKAAVSNLFEGTRCILTPSPRTDRRALRKVARLWKGVGARVELMEAGLHDRVLGAVSHLPQMIAFALMNSVAEIRLEKKDGRGTESRESPREVLSYCGGGFRDMTRIASSRPEMWRDICIQNRKEIVKDIERFEKRLERIRTMIEAQDGTGLELEFQKANQARSRILA